MVVCSVQVCGDEVVVNQYLQCLVGEDVISYVLLLVECLFGQECLVDVINVFDVVVIQLLLLCGLWLCIEVLVCVECVYEVYGQFGVLCKQKVLFDDVVVELEVCLVVQLLLEVGDVNVLVVQWEVMLKVLCSDLDVVVGYVLCVVVLDWDELVLLILEQVLDMCWDELLVMFYGQMLVDKLVMCQVNLQCWLISYLVSLVLLLVLGCIVVCQCQYVVVEDYLYCVIVVGVGLVVWEVLGEVFYEWGDVLLVVQCFVNVLCQQCGEDSVVFVCVIEVVVVVIECVMVEEQLLMVQLLLVDFIDLVGGLCDECDDYGNFCLLQYWVLFGNCVFVCWGY